ncbi:MAG: EAL domain-containing protein [Wenzhouxiangella sp.]|nr:EAL domain-containing protein [Wenzhouxiangella sp.]
MAITSLLVCALLWFQFQLGRESLTGRELARQELAWQSLLVNVDSRAQIWFKVFVDVPQVHRLLLKAQESNRRDQARADLVDWLEPYFEQMQSAGASIVHFHLPDGESFYRTYQPERFGDNVFEHRHTVRRANQTLQPVAAIEPGRLRTAYRHVRPIVDPAGRHLGSVEFSVPLSQLLVELDRKVPGRDPQLLLLPQGLPRDTARRAPISPWFGLAELSIQGPLENDPALPPRSDAGRQVYQRLAADTGIATVQRGWREVKMDGRMHLAVISPLTGARGETLGVLLSQAVEPGLSRLRRTLWLNTALATMTLSLLGIGTFILVRTQAAKLEERRRVERDLRLAASVFTHAREGIIVLAPDRSVRDVNEATCRISGYPREQIIGQRPEMLLTPEEQEPRDDGFWAVLEGNDFWSGELWARRSTGQRFPAMAVATAVRSETGELSHHIVLFSDITRQKQHEEQLYRIAYYDALTGLPNRALLIERVERAMNEVVVSADAGLVLGVVDLDGFKSINENHGQDVGDRVLSGVAKRLRQALPEKAMLGRLGGDEFCLIIPGLGGLPEVQKAVRDLQRELARPLAIPGHRLELQISASIGLTLFPQQAPVNADQLLRQADQAMYRAKQGGKNRYEVFDLDSDTDQRERLQQIAEVSDALKAGQLRLYYQPKVNLRSGELLGAEALVRWEHPERGLIGPGAFLPVIEHHVTEIELGRWVLREALNQIRRWRAEGLVVPIAVNVAGGHLQHPGFVSELERLVGEFDGLVSGMLTLEVVETSALEDVERVSEVIHACGRLGIRFDLDDFGTGYSSLTYLKKLPVERLKIDQSFVRDMLDDPEDLAILVGIMGLARAFGRGVVAEGIETEEEGRMLLRLGCEEGQGYAIARPMPAEEFPKWVSSWSPLASWPETPTASAEGQILIAAMTEHRAWVRGLDQWCRGNRADLPALHPQACRFGQRLRSGVLSAVIGRDLLEEVSMLHDDIHVLGEEIMNRREAGHFDQLPHLMADLCAKRDQLVQRMEEALGQAS